MSELRNTQWVLASRPQAMVEPANFMTAAHEVLALELAGCRAALYPGSWSEWVSSPERPVARGGAPG